MGELVREKKVSLMLIEVISLEEILKVLNCLKGCYVRGKIVVEI